MIDLSSEQISSINHSLKNVLASLHAYVQLTKRAAKRGELDKTIELTEKLGYQSQVLTDFIEDISEYAYLKCNLPLKTHIPVDLLEIFPPLINNLQQQYPQLTLEYDYQEPIMISGDREKLMTCFNRMITILSKLSESRGRITIRITSENNTCIITITATPLHLPPNLLNDFFTPFAFQDHIQGNNQSGLELTIAQAIISNHGGSTKISSDESRVFITCKLPGAPKKRT